MKSFKLTMIVLIVSSVLLFGLICIFISMNTIANLTEQTTVELVGTLTKVKVVDTGNNIYIEIHTEEYDDKLYISTNIAKQININEFNNLQEGQLVFFRVKDSASQLEENELINVLALKTSDVVFFSINDYNEYIRQATFPARIMCLLLMVIFLLIIIRCVRLLNGKITYFKSKN